MKRHNAVVDDSVPAKHLDGEEPEYNAGITHSHECWKWHPQCALGLLERLHAVKGVEVIFYSAKNFDNSEWVANGKSFSSLSELLNWIEAQEKKP